ncbi:MAG: DPP IV N-terminal domain-containing protein [Rhizomicrobium sp.]
MKSLPLSAAALCLVLAAPAFADRLTPERVFSDPDINGPTARDVQLSPDGTLVTWLKGKASDQNALDLWAADTKGGAPFMLVDSAKLEPKHEDLSEAEKARRQRMRISQHGVVEYHWDEEGKFILVPVDGDLYLANRASGDVRRLTDTKSDEIDSKVSPKGHYVSFVRDDNLYDLDLASGKETALTTGGKDPVSWGTAEFVAQEEMDRFTGYWWSEDETKIALTHVDEGVVDVIPRLEVNDKGLTSVDQRYPRAGRPNAIVELYVEDIATKKRVKMDLGKNTDFYLARVAWSKDSTTLYVQRLSRDQKRLDLLACDPAVGGCKPILTETSPHWVGLTNDFKPLNSGDFLWSSQRSGYRHIYLYDRAGKLLRQVTSGDWPVAAVEGVNEAKGQVLFSASIDTPLEAQLYAISYLTADTPHALTAGHGWWDVTVAKQGGAFTGTYSDPMTPPRTGFYAADGKLIRWIEENKLDKTHPYYPYVADRRIPGYGMLKADDGETLHYSIATPVGFDPHKKYPAIIEVYGGPHVQTVKRDWGSITDQLLLEAGYVVFKLDNRGSDNRSVAFKTAIYHRLGTVEVKDQLVGARYLRSLPYVDAKRIGISGWSYGGFMTLELMTAKAGFAAGASGAPPTDWSLYDTCYTERYMGTPAENPKGYADSDILNRLDNLSGRLLMLKGLSDDNVILANTTRVTSALQSRGIAFDMMEYPGERHGIHGNGKRLQLWRTYLEFFKRNLQSGL